MPTDRDFMLRALELAERGRFSTSPNPMVGCVIVQEEAVIGEGFHLRAGEPHAEREALASCTHSTEGSTIYVTLEPCSHHGRTPPCVDALLEAKPARVVVAMRDPNPAVNGEGIRRLQAAGIRVDVGVEGEAAEQLNEKFVFNQKAQLPFVLLKAGMSLDGKLATMRRKSQWITGEESRQRSLLLREEYDAILVGSGTVSEDDPQLTRRLGRSSAITPWSRVIVDASGTMPRSARVLSDGGRTIVFTSQRLVGSREVEVIPVGADEQLDLTTVLTALYERGIRSVIAEGGSLLHTSLITLQRWQKMMLFVAPMIVGGSTAPSIFMSEAVEELVDAPRLRFAAVETIGRDLLITAYPD